MYGDIKTWSKGTAEGLIVQQLKDCRDERVEAAHLFWHST